ncbi:MAG: hypothetical protein OEY24_07620 [Candidatus Bathyarchaeota archaeon]|nr:hypothetical protein [Candidatus Bathyarchaeota archaeon]
MNSDLNVNVDMAKVDVVVDVGLLSPELNYYVLKEKWWDWEVVISSTKMVKQLGRCIDALYR